MPHIAYGLSKKSIIGLTLWFALMLAGMAGCATAPKTPAEEGVVPFAVGKAGAKASININVTPLSLAPNNPREVVLMINPPGNKWPEQEGRWQPLYEKFDLLFESLTGKMRSEQGNIRAKAHTASNSASSGLTESNTGFSRRIR